MKQASFKNDTMPKHTPPPNNNNNNNKNFETKQKTAKYNRMKRHHIFGKNNQAA